MWSASSSNKSRAMHQQQPLCTRTHQIGSLLLVAATFFFTRLLDAPCSLSSSANVARASSSLQHKFPESSEVSLKIYVYDANEIDGLKELLQGREGKITPQACLKGQWGTQVISPLPIEAFVVLFFLC